MCTCTTAAPRRSFPFPRRERDGRERHELPARSERPIPGYFRSAHRRLPCVLRFSRRLPAAPARGVEPALGRVAELTLPASRHPAADGGGAGSAAPSTGGTGSGGRGLDADPPGLTLRGARSQRLGPRGQVRVTAILDEAGAIAGSGTVTTSGASRTFRLTGTRRTLRAPGTVVLKLRLSKRRLQGVRRALRRGLRARARIRITARDPAGNSTAARRTIRLRPR